jgi:CheY-like chemotaxis protein
MFLHAFVLVVYCGGLWPGKYGHLYSKKDFVVGGGDLGHPADAVCYSGYYPPYDDVTRQPRRGFMLKKPVNVTVISGALCLLYGVSLGSLWAFRERHPIGIQEILLSLFSIVLCVCSLAMIRRKEWARRLLVYINMIMAGYFYVMWLMLTKDNMMPAFLLMSLIVVLFFNQPMVRVHFRPTAGLLRKSILCVDDDEGVLLLLKRTLLPKGYSVLTARTGEKCLQIAKMQRPDLIVLDVILPGMKGREVCARLKAEEDTKHIPVVFLTAKDSLDDIAAEKAVGAVTHLTKPFNARKLLLEVKKLLNA